MAVFDLQGMEKIETFVFAKKLHFNHVKLKINFLKNIKKERYSRFSG